MRLTFILGTSFSRALLLVGVLMGAALAAMWLVTHPPEGFERQAYIAVRDAEARGGIWLGPLLDPHHCGLRSPHEPFTPRRSEEELIFAMGTILCSGEGSGLSASELRSARPRLTLIIAGDMLEFLAVQLLPLLIFVSGIGATIGLGYVGRRLAAWVRTGA